MLYRINSQGWLLNIEHQPSEHWDERPQGEEPSLLVLHCISLPPSQFGGGEISDFFCGRLNVCAHPYFATIASLRVSAHCLIQRDGSLTQYVSFDHRAWHAGVSNFAGRERCNDFSIGIELEGVDDGPYEKVQYQTLLALTQTLQHRYPAMTTDRITRHSDISPGRKKDPGPGFDWIGFKQQLQDL